MISVPWEALALKPASFSYAEASACGVSFLTAWQGLMNAGGLQKGETILIIGASGAVGSAAIQLAKAQDCRVLGTLSKASSRSGVSHLGADDWIALDEKNLSQAVLELTSGKGVSFVLDTVGGLLFEEGLKSLSLEGRQVAIASNGDSRVSFNLVDFYHKQARLIGVDTLKLSFSQCGEILNHLVPLMEKGKIIPPPISTFSLEESLGAYELVLQGTSKEKKVILF
jgi:NADPH:quinone reductase-like Zn-dependent oxidoreductase